MFLLEAEGATPDTNEQESIAPPKRKSKTTIDYAKWRAQFG
jgi:hypothetical protein